MQSVIEPFVFTPSTDYFPNAWLVRDAVIARLELKFQKIAMQVPRSAKKLQVLEGVKLFPYKIKLLASGLNTNTSYRLY